MSVDVFNQQRAEITESIIDSLNLGKVVHLGGIGRDICEQLAAADMVRKIVLEDDLEYFYLENGVKIDYPPEK